MIERALIAPLYGAGVSLADYQSKLEAFCAMSGYVTHRIMGFKSFTTSLSINSFPLGMALWGLGAPTRLEYWYEWSTNQLAPGHLCGMV